MNETPVVAAVLAALGTSPLCRVWRQNAGMLFNREGRPVRFGIRGGADISGLLKDGRRLEIKCKRPHGGRLREEQMYFGAMIRAHNGVYLVVCSADEAVAGVKQALEGKV